MRAIAAIRLPHFLAQLAAAKHRGLRGPLLVAHEGRVVDACEGGRRCGVQPGMPLSRALTLAVQAHVVALQALLYEEPIESLSAALVAFSPRVEPLLAPAAVFLLVDLSHLGFGGCEGSLREMAHTVGKLVGTVPAVGVAGGRFPAQVAAQLAPPGKALVVPPERARAFLAPLPIHFLPLDEGLSRDLALLGVHTLGDLAALPAKAVVQRFGSRGLFLHRLARGEDDRPIAEYSLPPKVEVRRELDTAVEDWAALKALLADVAREAHHQLALEHRAARRVRLVIEQEQGGPRGRFLVLRSPAFRPGRLAAVLQEMAQRIRLTAGVRAVHATFDLLVPHVGEQLPLLPEMAASEPWTELVVDLVARHGRGRFFRVTLREEGTLLPEERVIVEELGR